MPTITKTWITVGQVGDASRPRVIEENGSPASIQCTGLQTYTNYVVDAGCISDGLQSLAMQRVQFQTLRQNSLTATFNAVRRQGLNTQLEGGYIVYYDYVSLYALSSAILYVYQNGVQVGQYQGTADYNTSQITFGIPANDWVCCGAQYDLHVTVIDIFGASYTTPVTHITTDTLNLVTMAYDSSTTSSVTFDLDYWLDSGFASGWLDYWNEGDDPDVVQPQGHFHFLDGDTSVTANGLDEGTTYIFRVTVTLDDGQGTEIYTAYLNASTAGTDWSKQYFTITSLENNNYINLAAHANRDAAVSIDYSFDGETWNTATAASTVGIRIATLNEGRSIFLRGTMNSSSTLKRPTILSTKKITASGNIFSLTRKSLFIAGRTDTITSTNLYEFYGLFYSFDSTIDHPKLVSAKNVWVGSRNLTTIADYTFSLTFADGRLLEELPNFDKLGLTTLGESAFESMATGTKIKVTPNLCGVSNVGNNALRNAYSLTSNSLLVAYYPNTNKTTAVADSWIPSVTEGIVYVPSEYVKGYLENAPQTVLPSGWSVVVQAP